MNQTVEVEGIEVEVESRYRIEVNQWQASLRHPVHKFTVSEWASTPRKAVRAARRALLFYAGEMERVIGGGVGRARRRAQETPTFP
jgi:hypothetical protein